MNTTDDLDTPVDEATVIQPPDDDIDNADNEEHDAFGGAAPVNGDLAWRAGTADGIKKSAYGWMAAGFVAIAVASGAFFGMRNAANRATNASATGAENANGATGAPNFSNPPGAVGGPGGTAQGVQRPTGQGPQGAQGQAGQGQAGQGQAPDQDGTGDGPGGGFRGGPRGGTFGLLQSVDGSTLTLQERDGSTIKVTTTSSTQVTKIVDGTPQSAKLSDLTVGEPVMVRGTTASDGTVAATAIMQGRPPRGGRGDAGPGGGFGPPPDDQQQQPNTQQQGQQQDVRSA